MVWYVLNPTLECRSDNGRLECFLPFAGRVVSGSTELLHVLELFREPVHAGDPALSLLAAEVIGSLVDNLLVVPCSSPALARTLLVPVDSPVALCGWSEARPRIAPGAIFIVGAPVDTTAGCLARPSFGPAEIRKYLGVKAGRDVYDLGDIALYPDEGPEELFQRLRFVIEELSRGAAVPLVLGGDHTVTLHILASLSPNAPGLTFIQLDAHSDANAIKLGQTAVFPPNHANFVAHVRHALTAVGEVLQLGVRDPTVLGQPHRRPEGIRQLDATSCYDQGEVRAFLRSGVSLNRPKAYVSVDIDVLDPAFAPETTVPRVGGLSLHNVLEILQATFETYDVIGVDITEVCGSASSYNRAAHCAASIASWFIRRLRRPG